MKPTVLRIAAACSLLLMSPAAAETASEPSSAALLIQAAQTAKDFAKYRYAYTLDYRSSDGENEIAAKLRFDPRLEKGAQWTLLSPAEADLDKKARKALKQLQEGDTGDRPILYDGLHEVVGEADLVSETESEAVFVAQVNDDEAPKDALEVYITLDKAGGYVSSIELKSKQPFKPAPVAKVNSLTQTQRFAAPAADGPALIATSESKLEGEAMFKSFANETFQVFSDIERIDMPAKNTGE